MFNIVHGLGLSLSDLPLLQKNYLGHWPGTASEQNHLRGIRTKPPHPAYHTKVKPPLLCDVESQAGKLYLNSSFKSIWFNSTGNRTQVSLI